MNMHRLLLLSVLLAGPLTAQWSQTNLDSVFVTALFSDGSVVLAGTSEHGVYRSTDDGATWAPFNAGLPDSLVVYRFADGGTTILMGIGGWMYRTNAGGTAWSKSSNGIVDTQHVYEVITSGGTVYMSGAGGFYRSADNGVNWTRQGSDQGISCMLVRPSGIIAGTNGGSMIRSTDLGVNWSPFGTGATTMTTYDLARSGSRLVLGTYDGAFVSTNDGETWTPSNTGLTSSNIRSVVTLEGLIFVGTNSGVFASTDVGDSWIDISQGLFNASISSLEADGSYLYAGTETGVWRRPASQPLTSTQLTPAMPESYVLHPPYPNPFNPSTQIRFVLPSRARVTITVIDLLGREVARLVDETLEQGTYVRTWNADNTSGGMYLCRMDAGGSTVVRRVVLVK